MKVGSLFSGYGGLDLAAEAVFGAETVWHSELDPHASTVLAAHWPNVPNLGDITAVDWSTVEPIDVLCGGFPCQDISTAGKGAGIKEGTRSGLWFHMVGAVRALRPSLVVVENVSALLVRGLDVVLGDLAAVGYDAQWCSVRASDVGAPHQRRRVFLTAHPQGEGITRGRGRAAADASHVGHERGGHPRPGRAGSADSGQPAPHAGGQRHGRGQDGRLVGPVDREDALGSRERERSREEPGDRGAAPAPDADSVGRRHSDHRGSPAPVRPGAPDGRVDGTDGGSPSDFGPYAAAVARWAPIVGRDAPAPAIDGRLNPVFVEWMMGLPEGWVTDLLPRRHVLRCLGNGVVPQQAAHALRLLEVAR